MAGQTTPRPRRDLRLLVGAVGISALGDFLALITLALLVQERSDSGFVVALLFIALWGPAVVLSGVAGLVVDRTETRRLLLVVSLAQAVVTVALAFVDGVAPVIALTAVLGVGVAVSQPAEFALLPAVAGEDGIARANGHVETARTIGMTAGPLLGGFIAAAGGTRVALLIDAATFVAVAAAALALTARRAPRPSAAGAVALPERARDGIVFLLRDQVLRIVMVVAFVSLLFMSASMTAELFFATDVLDAGQTGYGVLITCWTAGMVFGGLVVARRVPATALVPAALGAVVVQGLGLGLPTAWLVFGFGAGVFVLGGIGHGVKNVLVRTLIHERVPDELRGRAFAAYNGLRNGAELVALAAGGLLVGAVGARTTLLLAGAGAVLAGLTALGVLRVRATRERRPSAAGASALAAERA